MTVAKDNVGEVEFVVRLWRKVRIQCEFRTASAIWKDADVPSGNDAFYQRIHGFSKKVQNFAKIQKSYVQVSG